MRLTHPMLVVSAVTLFSATQALGRIWTDDTGKFSVEAELYKIDGDFAVLKRKDGTTKRVPISRLSKRDQEFVAQVQSAATIALTRDPTPSETARMPGLIRVIGDKPFHSFGGNVRVFIDDKVNRLVAITWFKGSTLWIEIFDLKTGFLHKRFPLPASSYIAEAAIHPQSRTLITVLEDRTARVWDLDTGEMRFTLEGHIDYVWTLDISDDGKFCCTGSTDGSVVIWNLKNGQPRARLIPSAEGVNNWGVRLVDISSDSSKLAVVIDSGVRDRVAKIFVYDLAHLQQLFFVDAGPSVGAMTVSARDCRLLKAFCFKETEMKDGSQFGVSKLLSWNIPSGRSNGEYVLNEKDPVSDVVFNPTGNKLVGFMSKDNGLHIWDSIRGTELKRFPRMSGGYHAWFSKDDRLLVDTTHCWPLAEGTDATEIDLQKQYIAVRHFTQDGRAVAVIHNNIEFHEYDLNNGLSKLLYQRPPSTTDSGGFREPKFDASGSKVIFCDHVGESQLRVIDLASGKEIGVALPNGGSYALSADGRVFAFAEDSSTRIHLQRFGESQSTNALNSQSKGGTLCIALSDDASLLAAYDHQEGRLEWWNLKQSSRKTLTNSFPKGDFDSKIWFQGENQQIQIVANNGLYEANPVAGTCKLIATLATTQQLGPWIHSRDHKLIFERDGSLIILDTKSGKEELKADLGLPVGASSNLAYWKSALSAKEFVAVSATDKRIYVFDVGGMTRLSSEPVVEAPDERSRFVYPSPKAVTIDEFHRRVARVLPNGTSRYELGYSSALHWAITIEALMLISDTKITEDEYDELIRLQVAKAFSEHGTLAQLSFRTDSREFSDFDEDIYYGDEGPDFQAYLDIIRNQFKSKNLAFIDEGFGVYDDLFRYRRGGTRSRTDISELARKPPVSALIRTVEYRLKFYSIHDFLSGKMARDMAASLQSTAENPPVVQDQETVDKKPTEIVVSGRVIDKKTGRGLKGVSVKLSYAWSGGDLFGTRWNVTTITDYSGAYSHKFSNTTGSPRLSVGIFLEGFKDSPKTGVLALSKAVWDQTISEDTTIPDIKIDAVKD